MIDDDRGTSVPQAYAQEKLGDPGLLLTGVSANYLARDGGNVRFYHQMMQEFFAAVRLGRFGLEGVLQEPKYGYMPYRVHVERLQNWRFSTKWDEVVVTLCGISDAPSRVVSHLLMTDPVLAVHCVASGVLLDLEMRRKIRDQLIAELRGDDWRVVASVAVAFGRLNDPEAVPQLLAILREEPEEEEQEKEGPQKWERQERQMRVREAAARALGELGGQEAAAGLRNALNCVSSTIRDRAAQALGVIGDPIAVPDLIFHLGDHDRTGMRKGSPMTGEYVSTSEFAQEALLKIATRSPDAVLTSLIDALRSPHAPTRKNAADMLGRVWDQRATPALSDAFTYDTDPDVRSAAAKALGWIKTGSRPCMPALYSTADWADPYHLS